MPRRFQFSLRALLWTMMFPASFLGGVRFAQGTMDHPRMVYGVIALVILALSGAAWLKITELVKLRSRDHR